MSSQLNLYWRVFATGLSFVSFGVGGLLLRVLVFPMLNLMVWHRQQRTALAREVIRAAFLTFVGLMKLLGVLRYELVGGQRLKREGLLILANHPTLIDTVFLMAFVKRADCIVKAGLWNNPFTRGPVRSAGYINNDQGANLVVDCIASLEAGNNLIVFPEGTRTPSGGSIRLKRGAANIAVRGKRHVTPVLISCRPMTLGKGDKWWHVPSRFARFRIEVQEDIQIDDFIANDVSEVMAARHLTDYLQTYFTERNQHHA
ncbi:MAG: lysophospholipid acyltransferase family protein [Undibacterium sp.]|nr:lysophospholipid acyltransferase family protein [Undibacterium sp.]